MVKFANKTTILNIKKLTSFTTV